MKTQFGILFLALVTFPLLAAGPKPKNKLKEMLRLYYLPFSIEFQEGTESNEIIPIKPDPAGLFNRLVDVDDMRALDSEWNSLKATWRKKSLLSSTDVALNQSARITSHLISHHIPATRSAFDVMSIEERAQVQEYLKNKPKEIQAGVLQLQYLQSFLRPMDLERFNFFIVSPHWCESSREYRTLLEAYVKEFPESELILHSVVVEDPKEEIFDSNVFRDLFPNPKKYSHESVPRFIAMEVTKDGAKVYEEGEALEVLYDRFFLKHRGFLDKKTTLLKNIATVLDQHKNIAAK